MRTGTIEITFKTATKEVCMMNYKEIRSIIEEMAKENHKDFIKALISFEKGIHDKEALGTLYERYMENDSMSLLHDEFDYMIDELRESGQIRDNVSFEKEDNDLVNIVGNVVGKIEVIERVSKTGEAFEVVNFSVVSKDTEGNKHYTNCSAYGEKADIPKGFKPGDFVKLFGQERKFIDENGKEHRNVKVLSTKLLKEQVKVREQNKGKWRGKEIENNCQLLEQKGKDARTELKQSILETIKKLKEDGIGNYGNKLGLLNKEER